MAATSKVVPAMWLSFVILPLILQTEATKLNVPKVLLPYFSTVATNFTLEVSDGCFKWRSSRSEIVTVTGLNVHSHGDCSSKAVVTAVSKTPTRVTSIVIAEDSVSGQQLRCDVIVDAIHNISIETTTRELYLEDSPMQFILRASDDEGNVFSNLEGLSFEWNLISDTNVEQEAIVDAHNVLRILSYSESAYETPPHIQYLEKHGKQGDKILVEGIRTGSAKVSAKLVDPVYKNVPETIVRLIVIANIMLNPPLVYMLKHSHCHYRVELLKQGKVHEIRMPSQQYLLVVKDEQMCRLEKSTSVVTATNIGFTEIVLKDKNIKVKEAFRQPSGGIYVVNPGYLAFVVLPGRKWVLEAGRNYEVLIEIYDKDSHKIHPSDNVRVVATFDKAFFSVYSSSLNGTHHSVRALKRGFTNIQGHLKAIIVKDGTELLIVPIIKNSQDVEIYDPIAISPSELIFPWDVTMKSAYQFTLEATGGSGNYTWSSSDTAMTNVNVRGLITATQLGEAIITAADVRNAAHTDSMTVYMVPPSSLEFVASTVEAEIGTILELSLAMYGYIGKTGREKKMYSDCRRVPYTITLKDPIGFIYEPEELPLTNGSCTTIKILVKKLGHTEVTATYMMEKLSLMASVTIAGYKPLKPVDPEDVAVVAVGSSMEVVFQDGPQPWVLQPGKYKQTVAAENGDIVKMTHIHRFGARKTLHSFRVLCKALGEQFLTVTVGNGITSKNKFPASRSAKVGFACAAPVGLYLHPIVAHPIDLPPCPIPQDSTEPIPVHSDLDLDLGVVVTDNSGRRFNNFSSLSFVWELSDENIAIFGNSGQLKTDVTPLESGKNLADSYQELLMLRKLGPLQVTALVTGYQKRYLSPQGISFPELLETQISATVDLYSVTDPIITPDTIAIFNHPSNKVSLKISGGSGFFLVVHSNTNLAKLTYESKKRDIMIMPLLEGSFTVKAYDLCMETSETAYSEIHISGVNTILMKVVDKVELKKEITVRASVLDKNGKALLASYFPLMVLKPHPASNIITLKLDPTKNDDPFSVQYIIHGASIGRTMLHFEAKTPSGRIVSSQHKEIQVFPPLKLNPSNITLTVGALFQVQANGGPQPQSTIEFNILSNDVAEISNSGLIDAQTIGQTTVVGRAVGYEADNGQRIVYSEDVVNVFVIQLIGVRIFAPLKRLQTKTKMSLYAMGMNDNDTPFTFGSALPPLIFTWTTNNKEAVSINSIYYKSGMKVRDESNFEVQVFTHKPGYVTISLTVTTAPNSQQFFDTTHLYDEVQLQVFDELQLLSPASCGGMLLITPNTETKVKTNRDGTARLSYVIDPPDDDNENATPVAKVDKSGRLVSGAATGHASLIIMSREDFGVNQTVVIVVKVKLVSYLMMNADTVINTLGQRLSMLPVGSVLHYTVKYYDDVGERFHVTNTALRYRLSRFDLVHVQKGTENSTLVARTTSIGQTILKIWDKNNPGMADYINIEVGSAISPDVASVTLGDVVCFSSPIVSAAGHIGEWSSSSSTVLAMSSVSGIGMASRIGQSVITYSAGEHTTNTEITVAPVTAVLMKNEHLQHWTNVAGRASSSHIPVYLESHRSGNTNLVGANCSVLVASERYLVPTIPLRCEASLSNTHQAVDVHDLVELSAHFDSTTGHYVCRLARVVLPDILYLISTLDTTIQLRAVVSARESQPEVSSGVVSLPFLPAFYVHSGQIALSNVQALGAIRISATDRVSQDIKVTVCNPAIIQVDSPERDGPQEHLIQFPVRVIDSAALWQEERHEVVATVKCLTTGQTDTVLITIRLIAQDGQVPGERREAGWGHLLHVIANNYQNWIFMLLCIFVIVFTLFISYHAMLSAKNNAASQQASVFLQQGGHSPIPSPYQAPSPWNSPYSTGTSPSKLQMWTVGYDADRSPNHLTQRSPHNRSPFSS